MHRAPEPLPIYSRSAGSETHRSGGARRSLLKTPRRVNSSQDRFGGLAKKGGGGIVAGERTGGFAEDGKLVRRRIGLCLFLSCFICVLRYLLQRRSISRPAPKYSERITHSVSPESFSILTYRRERTSYLSATVSQASSISNRSREDGTLQESCRREKGAARAGRQARSPGFRAGRCVANTAARFVRDFCSTVRGR